MRELGARALAELETMVADGLATEARGRGLMLGLDLPRPRAAEVVQGMLEAGFLINNTSARTIRMLPPLVIGDDDLDALLGALRRTVSGLL